ncbi:alpha/beta hydrolase domain-containing protein [Mesorhizobium sp. ISC25]|uniref:alpha/beta hydrolase domain-containing protein n=1 Tax=Mesorhizobium sp. ISC25 TaxID=3077335 RepID=UPI0035D7BCBD
MTQVSKALKDNAGDNPPLPGLTVEDVIALGESQSAHRLTRYYNTIQPLYDFFDGFVFLDLPDFLPAVRPSSRLYGGGIEEPLWEP